MATSGVRLKGFVELGTAIAKLPIEIQDKVARRSVSSGAAVIRNIAVAKAPKSNSSGKISGVNITSGNLKRSIYIRRVKETSLMAEYEVAVRAPKRVNAKQKATGKVGAYYWRFVEFGTSKMGARPFMRLAATSGKGDAADTIKSVLGNGIVAAAAKLGASSQ